VQEGRGGYGAHTVKNWCARRARGTQGRDRSEGRAKWWTRGKTKKQKKPVEKKKKIFGPSTLHENRPPSPTKKTLRVYLRTTCTSGKGLYGHKRSTCVLYRNIVSTRVCANNFFSVVQNGSAVVPWHYRPRVGNCVTLDAASDVEYVGTVRITRATSDSLNFSFKGSKKKSMTERQPNKKTKKKTKTKTKRNRNTKTKKKTNKDKD
jgi:hypothetical protein